MRAALSILLFFLLSHQLLLKLGIVAWYEWNKDYVAQNLCENRDKPSLKCCGKCYLHKQLAKADQAPQSGKPAIVRLIKLKMSPFLLPQPSGLRSAFAVIQKQGGLYSLPFAEEVAQDITHPPG